jgi:hypothetical protein
MLAISLTEENEHSKGTYNETKNKENNNVDTVDSRWLFIGWSHNPPLGFTNQNS